MTTPGPDQTDGRCTCPLNEQRQCIQGRVYGPCTHQLCGGVCEYEGQCQCPVHAVDPGHDALNDKGRKR